MATATMELSEREALRAQLLEARSDRDAWRTEARTLREAARPVDSIGMDAARRLFAQMDARRERIHALERHVLVLGLHAEGGSHAVTPAALGAALAEVERLKERD